MAPTARRSVASHFGIYAIGNVLMLLAGFVTFPITTRALSAEDFGVLGYWEVWCLFFVAIAKLGSSEMMIRYYPHGGSEEDFSRYGINHVAIPMLIAVAIWFTVFLTALLLVSLGVVTNGRVALLAIGLVLLQSTATLGFARLAAGEHSSSNMLTSIIQRWLTVGFTALFLLHLLPAPEGALLARMIPYVIVLAWLLSWILRRQPMPWNAVDIGAIRSGLAFSAPLALKEISNIILVLGNRVMLQWMAGSSAAVGIFTIGFSLAMYFEQIISSALSMALTPAMSRLFQSGGAEAVRELKKKVIVPLVHISFLGSSLLACHGIDVIQLISGSGKEEAAPVFVLAGMSYLLQAAASVMGAGLILEKKTGRIFALTACAAVLNLAFNYVLIPGFGLLGAAFATCFSQLLLQVALFQACPANLRCIPTGRTMIAGAIFASVLCVGDRMLVAALSPDLAGRLFIAAALSFVLYVLPISYIEPVIRSNIRLQSSGFLRRFTAP